MSEHIGARPVSRRAFLGGTAFVAASTAGLAACGRRDDGTTEGQTSISYYIGNPPSIDPYDASDVAGAMVIRQLFDPLYVYDFQKQELQPLAAESYTVNEEGTEFEFKIKQGMTFTNGDPVNAQAFQRSWNRLVNPKTGSGPSQMAYLLGSVQGYDDVVNGNAEELSGLSCPDDYTFHVTLSEAYQDFLMICTLTNTVAVPQAAIDDYDNFKVAPIGYGPWKMNGKWVDGQYINTTINEDYTWGDKAQIDNLNFNIQNDPQTGYREFQAGNIDIVDIPTNQVRDAENQYGTSEDGYTITPGHAVCTGAKPSTYYLAINLNDDTLKDVNLRRALSLAINRDSIVQSVYDGYAQSAGNLVAPGIQGYVENEWEYSHYDQDQANQILDQYYPKDANGSRGINLTLSFNNDGDHQTIMESVQASLEAVGISVTLDQQEWASYLDRLSSGNFQIARQTWSADYPTMDNFLYAICFTGSGNNYAKYSNEEVDQLILKARATKDESQRIATYQDANKIIGEAVPDIPLFYSTLRKVGSNRIRTAYIAPNEMGSATGWELNA